MQFTKEELQNLANEDYDTETWEVLLDFIVGSSRWSVESEMVFKYLASGKIYRSWYSRGATEQQDESPYENEGDMIECQEVEAVKVKSIQYKPIV